MAENRLQIFRAAVAELRDAAPEQLVAFIHQKYGVRIEPKYVPFYKAALRDKDSQKPASPASQVSEAAAGQQGDEQHAATTSATPPEADGFKAQAT